MTTKFGLYEIHVYDSEWELVIEYDSDNKYQADAVEEIKCLFHNMMNCGATLLTNINKIDNLIKDAQIEFEWVRKF